MTNAGSNTDRRDTALADVVSTLWRERELLDQLVFALTCQQQNLAAGGIRFLTAAGELVRTAGDALADCELRRAIVTTELALLLELPADATLERIATASDAPWNDMLAEHRIALRGLAGEVETLAADNQRLLRTAADLVGLPGLASSAGVTGTSGSALDAYPGSPARRASVDPMLVDRQA